MCDMRERGVATDRGKGPELCLYLKPDILLRLLEPMEPSLSDCVKKSDTLCTYYCIEMRILVERIYEFGEGERE